MSDRIQNFTPNSTYEVVGAFRENDGEKVVGIEGRIFVADGVTIRAVLKREGSKDELQYYGNIREKGIDLNLLGNSELEHYSLQLKRKQRGDLWVGTRNNERAFMILEHEGSMTGERNLLYKKGLDYLSEDK